MKVGCKEINLIQISQVEPIGRIFHQRNVVTFLTSEGISCTVRAKNSKARKRCNIEVPRKSANVFFFRKSLM
jgi:hypothetical protein